MQRSAQAVHRQGAARDLSAGLDLQVRHRARRARGRAGRRGRDRCSAPASTSSRARTFRCNGSHGKVDLLKAIQHSCNVYFWKLAQRIGLDRIAEVAREFGFGAPTNLGLNGDAGGRIPTKAWYEQQRPLQDRLRDQRGDRAGRRRGHRAADGDGVRGARERRHAVRAAGRRARRGERRPHDRRVRAEGRARRQDPADALDIWRAACGRSPTSRAAPRSITATVELVAGDGQDRHRRDPHAPQEGRGRARRRGLAPDALARVVRGLGAGRGSRDRDRRVRRARRLGRHASRGRSRSRSSRATSRKI